MNLSFGPHVPDSSTRVTTAGDQDINGRMEGQRVHGTQVPMIVTDNLIILQVPTLYSFIFSG